MTQRRARVDRGLQSDFAVPTAQRGPRRCLPSGGSLATLALLAASTACAPSVWQTPWMEDREIDVASGYDAPPEPIGADLGLAYIAEEMDVYHRQVVIYDDHESGSSWSPSGWMKGPSSDWTAADVKRLRVTHPRRDPVRGPTCMRVEWSPERADSWAGIAFLSTEDDFSVYPGRDLTGATTLSFWARGDCGNEVVELSFAGIDCRRTDAAASALTGPQAPCRSWDTSESVSTGSILLEPRWRRYELDLRGRCLENVLGGFIIVFSAAPNVGECCFELDEITIDLARPNEPRLIRSFRAGMTDLERMPPDGRDIRQLRNTSYVYDVACACCAFLSVPGEDQRRRARLLADALVELAWREPLPNLSRDRPGPMAYLRVGYSCGDLLAWNEPGLPVPEVDVASTPGHSQSDARVASPPSRELRPRVLGPRLPGKTSRKPKSTDASAFEADAYAMSVDTGVIAWAAIALLNVWAAEGANPESEYLDTARALARWVLTHHASNPPCNAAAGLPDAQPAAAFRGTCFHGGYEWKCDRVVRVDWASTEHHLDWCVVFTRLAEVDARLGREIGDWRKGAQTAADFIRWAIEVGRTQQPAVGLVAGVTTLTGDRRGEPSIEVLPLDPQTWSVLALVDTPAEWSPSDEDHCVDALIWAVDNLRGREVDGKQLPGFTYSVLNPSAASNDRSPTSGSPPRDASEKTCGTNDVDKSVPGIHRRGTWPEGTGQMLLALRKAELAVPGCFPEGATRANEIATFLDELVVRSRGGVPSAWGDLVEQGFKKFNKTVMYYPVPSLAATAWTVMALSSPEGYNPFWGTPVGQEHSWQFPMR